MDLFHAKESDPVNSLLSVQVPGGMRYSAGDAGAILSLPNVNPVVDVSSIEPRDDIFVGSRVIPQIAPA